MSHQPMPRQTKRISTVLGEEAVAYLDRIMADHGLQTRGEAIEVLITEHSREQKDRLQGGVPPSSEKDV